MRNKGTPMHCWWECESVQPLQKTVWRFLKKWQIELPYDPAIPLLSIEPKDMKSLTWREICTPMFIAALLTIAKTGKQPKCPSVNARIQKVITHACAHTHTHTGMLLSHTKGNPAICSNLNEPWGHCAEWRKSDRERQTLYHRTSMWSLKALKSQKQQTGGYQGWGGMGETGRSSQRAQTFSYRMKKLRGHNVQHGDYTALYIWKLRRE